jgi:hypothetical protein
VKISRSGFFLIAACSLAGCALLLLLLLLLRMQMQTEPAAIPDERAGPNLVVYFAEDGGTRRIARTIARTTGGELFDIGGKKPMPDLLGYETFFVGASLAAGRIPAPLEDFLARTDFIDGRVVPFWTSREERRPGPAAPRPPDAGPPNANPPAVDLPDAYLPDVNPPDAHPSGASPGEPGPEEDMNGEFERILRGARFLPGGGFRFPRRIRGKDVEEMTGIWAAAALDELGRRRAAGGDQAEEAVKLFAAAYTGRLGPAIFQDGDWTLEMDGARWYYARGRFLPQEELERAEDFRPQFLYRYSPEPPAGPGEANPWQDEADRIISRRPPASYSAYRQGLNPGAIRSPFFAALWQARDRAEAYAHQKWIVFLGRRVQIHQDIEAPLGRVETRIQELAANDPEIRGWITNLQSITGWNWRNVAGSTNLSFHAFGAAVDLLMKTQAGMETYWQWTAAKGIDWRSVPAERRQNPPVAAIRAFEDQGFIWGGRWSRYDTMHFEYHPELLILGTGRSPEGAA